MRSSQARKALSLPLELETWLRAAIIGATLLSAVIIGLWPASRISWIPGLVVFALLAFVALIRYLPWAVVAIIPISFLVDIPIKTGTKVNINATFLMVPALLGVWLLRMLVVDKKLRLSPSPANLPALLFIVACTLAWLVSFLPWVPLATAKPRLSGQLGAYLLYVLSIGAFLLAANTLQSLRLIKTFTWSFIGFGTVYMFTIVFTGNYETYKAWFVDVLFGSSVYWTLLASLCMGQALFNRKLNKLLRLALLACAATVVAFGLFRRSDWVSGWLPPLIALFGLLWLYNWRAGVAAALLGALAVIPNFESLYAMVSTETQIFSSFSRVATWPIMFELIKINPLTGLGPANYSFYTSIYSYLGYYINFNSHNNYFDIILQTGLLGLATFAWLAMAILWMGWKVRRQTKDTFSRAYASAMIAGLVAILISGTFVDWFLPFVYNIGVQGFQGSVYIWLFSGGLASLYMLQNKQPIDE